MDDAYSDHNTISANTYCRSRATDNVIEFSKQPYVIGTIILPQMRK